MSIAAAAIAGTAALAGAGISAYGQGKTNKLGATLTREGRAYDRKQWEDTNAYNSPLMQMQRLREAGLNPNLVYGGGSAQSHASLPPAAKIPEVKNELAALENMNIAPIVSLYQDWQVKKVQIDNMKKQGDLMDQDKLLRTLDQINKQIKNDTNLFDLSQKKKMGETQVSILGENLRRILLDMDKTRLNMDITRQTLPYILGEKSARIRNLQQSTKGMELDYEFQKGLKPYGVSANDNFFLRKLAPLLSIPSKESGNRKAFWNSYFNNK